MITPAFTPPVRYAILVGGLDFEQENGKLGVQKIIDELEVEFRERGFRVVPMRENVQKESLSRLLDEAQRLSMEALRLPTFIFYYCGHHGIPGFQLNNGIYDRNVLMEKLRRIRGEKLAIFDCCHAGMMGSYSGIGMTILAATQEGYLAYADRKSEGNRLLLSDGILKFMKHNPGRFPLGSLFECLNNNLTITQWQNPGIRGAKEFIFPNKEK